MANTKEPIIIANESFMSSKKKPSQINQVIDATHSDVSEVKQIAGDYHEHHYNEIPPWFFYLHSMEDSALIYLLWKDYKETESQPQSSTENHQKKTSTILNLVAQYTTITQDNFPLHETLEYVIDNIDYAAIYDQEQLESVEPLNPEYSGDVFEMTEHASSHFLQDEELDNTSQEELIDHFDGIEPHESESDYGTSFMDFDQSYPDEFNSDDSFENDLDD